MCHLEDEPVTLTRKGGFCGGYIGLRWNGTRSLCTLDLSLPISQKNIQSIVMRIGIPVVRDNTIVGLIYSAKGTVVDFVYSKQSNVN
jgi:hypothetical protein